MRVTHQLIIQHWIKVRLIRPTQSEVFYYILYLKRTNFRIYFSRAKKILFCEYLFSRMTVYEFRVYKFQPQRKKNKKNNWIIGDSANFFCQDQRVDVQIKMEKLLLLIDSKKSWINQHFFVYFFWCICFREIWILCKFIVYLFSQMPFRRKFRVCLILRNRPKLAKFVKICTCKS